MIDFDSLVVQPLVDQVFGEPFSFTLIGAGTYQINGVFDAAYEEVNLAGGTPVMTSGPVVGIRVADLLSQPGGRMPKQGDQCTRLGTGDNFVIQKPKPDSHGHALMKLNAR